MTLTTVDAVGVGGAVVVVVIVVDVDEVGDGVGSLIPAADRRRTYGPVLFGVVNELSPTVRSVVPHLNHKSHVRNSKA